MSARPKLLARGGPVVLDEAGFRAAGIDRTASIHTKTRLELGWRLGPVRYTAEYWQVAEDFFAAEVTATNTASAEQDMAVDILLALNAKTQALAGSASAVGPEAQPMLCLDAKGSPTIGVIELPQGSGGGGGGGGSLLGRAFFADTKAAAAGLATKCDQGPNASFAGATGTGVATFTHGAKLGAAGSATAVWAQSFLVGRGAGGCSAAAEMLNGAKNDLASPGVVRNAREVAKDDDNVFWAKGPRLSGDWPASWGHGVVYDLNTVRLNLRPAVGIFKTEWDAMQTSHPRVVVAESTMDYLAISYADRERPSACCSGV